MEWDPALGTSDMRFPATHGKGSVFSGNLIILCGLLHYLTFVKTVKSMVLRAKLLDGLEVSKK